MKFLAGIFASPERFERCRSSADWVSVLILRRGVITSLPGLLGGWTAIRDVYPVANQTFREWWRERQRLQAPAPARPGTTKGSTS